MESLETSEVVDKVVRVKAICWTRRKVIGITTIMILLVILGVVLGTQITKTEIQKGEKIIDNNKTERWKDNIRLPTALTPNLYTIALDIDMEKENFNGSAKLNITVVKSTDTIVVHANKIDIDSFQVFSNDGTEVKVLKRFPYPKFHFYVAQLRENLTAGRMYNIKTTYNGSISRTSLNGLYINTYKDVRGATKKIASTFLHPVSAREILPCFDEPQMKAEFLLTLSYQRNYTAVANTKVASEIPVGKDRRRTSFKKTVKMSSYLLCFAVSEYRYLTNDDSNLEVRTYSKSENVVKTQDALNFATSLLPYLENFYGVKYPLEKLDLMAVPSLSAGAMENWGLITFRMNKLVLTRRADRKNKYTILRIVAHELAHMWFGNLVTMKWWDDSWLNEGNVSKFD